MEFQSGPSSMDVMTWPSQLSPMAIESLLCIELACVGVMSVNTGRFPPAASVVNWLTFLRFWASWV